MQFGKLTMTASVIVACALAAPASLRAQDASAAPDAHPATAEQLVARIQAIQAQALQDPELRAANRAIAELIAETLPRVDADYPKYAERAQTIRVDVAAAQEAADNARLTELAEETKELQAKVAAAQERAREDPAVRAELEAFRTRLFAKMLEIEPTVQALVAQLEEARADGAAAASP